MSEMDPVEWQYFYHIKNIDTYPLIVAVAGREQRTQILTVGKHPGGRAIRMALLFFDCSEMRT